MPVPLRSRADLKRAGREMGEEAAVLLTRYMLGMTEEQLRDDAVMHDAISRMLEAMEGTAQSYLRIGLPPLWVQKFRSTFLRTAGERLKEVGAVASLRLASAQALAALPSPSPSLN